MVVLCVCVCATLPVGSTYILRMYLEHLGTCKLGKQIHTKTLHNTSTIFYLLKGIRYVNGLNGHPQCSSRAWLMCTASTSPSSLVTSWTPGPGTGMGAGRNAEVDGMRWHGSVGRSYLVLVGSLDTRCLDTCFCSSFHFAVSTS